MNQTDIHMQQTVIIPFGSIDAIITQNKTFYQLLLKKINIFQ